MELALMLARIGYLAMTSPELQRLAKQLLEQGITPETLTWEDCRMRTVEEIQAQIKAEFEAMAKPHDPRQMNLEDTTPTWRAPQ